MLTALSAGRVLGANDRIRVGLIGAGGRGNQLWPVFVKQPGVEPIAVCDVYEPFVERAITVSEGKAKGYKDFRHLLDRQDIDAVIIAPPDHWHAIMTVMACEAGKDVYVEKPLSLVAAEGRKMADAVRAHKRIAQTGSQQRSSAHYQEAVQLIKEGGLGEVRQIKAGYTRNVYPGFKPLDVDASKLDWDMWLGPAPAVPFDPFRSIYHFRWFWDYSGGQMTNWGAHNLDIARWIIGAKAPTKVSGVGGRYALNDGGETPDVQEVLYDFPGCVVTWTGREINEGNRMFLDIHGSKGTMELTRGGYRIRPEVVGQGKDRKPAMAEVEVASRNDMVEAHIQNFLDCARSRKTPNTDIEEGHQTSIVCHLGNLATRLGRTMQWDAEKEKVIGDPEANKALQPDYRKPWKLG